MLTDDCQHFPGVPAKPSAALNGTRPGVHSVFLSQIEKASLALSL